MRDDEFFVHDPDHLLARRKTLQNLGANGSHPYLFDEILDDFKVYIGLKKNQSYFAQGVLDILLGHYALAAKLFKD